MSRFILWLRMATATLAVFLEMVLLQFGLLALIALIAWVFMWGMS